MTKYQKTLLAGVATLAIAVGTGFASAQSPSGGAAGSSGAAGQSPASPSAPGESGGQGGGMSQPESGGMSHSGNGSGMQQPQTQKQPGSTEESGKSGSQQNAQGAGTKGRSAEESQKQPGKQPSGKRGAQNGGQGAQPGKNKGTAERERTQGGRNQGTAERDRSMRGLQGNASEPMQGAGRTGGNVRFTDQQRTTIRRTVIDARGAPRAGRVDFDVRVGTVVPRGSIHVTTVPQTLVRIEPRWRGYLYFVYEDQIVIVNPRNMHIVAVVAV